MKILITGSAGFIGYALTIKMLELGHEVIGIDNHNDYYNPRLKEDRLARYLDHDNYQHFCIAIIDTKAVLDIFKNCSPKIVIHMAAQAGVRYLIENPSSYINSNLVGFGNILEGCRRNSIQHLVLCFPNTNNSIIL